MAPSVAQTARIFEDPLPAPASILASTSTSPKKRGYSSPIKNKVTSNPLGERHINSPPQPKKIPLKDEPQSRPQLHKKAGSATSFKGFLLGREKSREDNYKVEDENVRPEKPKKSKSSTNLASLLKKKSKKDLKQDEPRQEPRSPTSPTKVHTPIWAQFATQPVEGEDGSKQYPIAHSPALGSGKPSPLTPLTYSDQHMAGQGLVQSYFDIDAELRMPQRPYLEKRGSRSSIFTEEIHESASTRPASLDFSQSRPSCSRQQSAESGADTTEMKHTDEPSNPVKAKSRVLDVISVFNIKSRRGRDTMAEASTNESLNAEEVDSAFENVLGKYDIPQNLRDHMRNLKPEVKAGLVKGERIGSGSSNGGECLSSRSNEEDRPSSKDKENEGRRSRSRSRSRPRSRVFSMSKKSKDSSFAKAEDSTRSRSKTRPKSVDLGGRPLSAISNISTTSLGSLALTPNDGTSTPGDFIHYLREVQKPELVEVGKIHKLRILLRNESVQWTDVFVKKGGMDAIVQLLHRIMKIEWREEHEDNLLHETLLCMKALTTTQLAMQRLETMEQDLFPALLKMLFDPERKGPAEFTTRAVIIALVFAYLSGTLYGSTDQHEQRSRVVLELMRDERPDGDKQPLDFVSQMHTSRPYRTWCREISNVTKEVFWIFLHHMNVVPVVAIESNERLFSRHYYPVARAPHPAAPYVGGVEWEATQYLATHLDLLNGLIVSLPSAEERNQLRDELKSSGFEKIMGSTLRTCKEKFYGAVHDGLRSWVSAARADGWAVEDVRAGPPREVSSPKKSPVKKKQDEAPQLQLDVDLGHKKADEGWL